MTYPQTATLSGQKVETEEEPRFLTESFSKNEAKKDRLALYRSALTLVADADEDDSEYIQTIRMQLHSQQAQALAKAHVKGKIEREPQHSRPLDAENNAAVITNSSLFHPSTLSTISRPMNSQSASSSLNLTGMQDQTLATSSSLLSGSHNSALFGSGAPVLNSHVPTAPHLQNEVSFSAASSYVHPKTQLSFGHSNYIANQESTILNCKNSSHRECVSILPYMPTMKPYTLLKSTTDHLLSALRTLKNSQATARAKSKARQRASRKAKKYRALHERASNYASAKGPTMKIKLDSIHDSESDSSSTDSSNFNSDDESGNATGSDANTTTVSHKTACDQGIEDSDSDQDTFSSSRPSSSCFSMGKDSSLPDNKLLWPVQTSTLDIKSIPWTGIRWRSYFNIDQNCVTLAQVEASSTLLSPISPFTSSIVATHINTSPLTGLSLQDNSILHFSSASSISSTSSTSSTPTLSTPTSSTSPMSFSRNSRLPSLGFCPHDLNALSPAVHIPFVSSRIFATRTLYPRLLRPITGSGGNTTPVSLPFSSPLMHPVNGIYTSSSTFLFGAAQSISLEGADNRFLRTLTPQPCTSSVAGNIPNSFVIDSVAKLPISSSGDNNVDINDINDDMIAIARAEFEPDSVFAFPSLKQVVAPNHAFMSPRSINPGLSATYSHLVPPSPLEPDAVRVFPPSSALKQSSGEFGSAQSVTELQSTPEEKNPAEMDENTMVLLWKTEKAHSKAVSAVLHGVYDAPTHSDSVFDYLSLTVDSLRCLRQEFLALRTHYAKELCSIHSDSLQTRNPFRDIHLYEFKDLNFQTSTSSSHNHNFGMEFPDGTKKDQNETHEVKTLQGATHTTLNTGSHNVRETPVRSSVISLSSAMSDPLSQLQDGVWRVVFAYKELEGLIHKDLLRTHAAKSFFRLPRIFDMCKRILIIWALQHSSLGYKQGFNEILAIVILALRGDQISGSDEIEVSDCVLENIAWDDEILEADAYVMLSRILRNIGAYYAPLEQAQKPISSGPGSQLIDISASPAAVIMAEGMSLKVHSSKRFTIDQAMVNSPLTSATGVANKINGNSTVFQNNTKNKVEDKDEDEEDEGTTAARRISLHGLVQLSHYRSSTGSLQEMGIALTSSPLSPHEDDVFDASSNASGFALSRTAGSVSNSTSGSGSGSGSSVSNSVAEVKYTTGGSGATSDLSDREASQTLLSQKMNYIHHTLLRLADPVLYKALTDAEVLPQLYLLRWFRLLFAREFTLEQTMNVWDHLFSHSQNISLELQQQREMKELCKEKNRKVAQKKSQKCEQQNQRQKQTLLNNAGTSSVVHSSMFLSDDSEISSTISEDNDFTGEVYSSVNLLSTASEDLVSENAHNNSNSSLASSTSHVSRTPNHAHSHVSTNPSNAFSKNTYCLGCFESHIKQLEKMNDLPWEDAEDAGLGIAVDFFSLAMILHVRSHIISEDEITDPSMALMALMRYPPVKDVREIIDSAIHLYARSKKGVLGMGLDDVQLHHHLQLTKLGTMDGGRKRENGYVLIPSAIRDATQSSFGFSNPLKMRKSAQPKSVSATASSTAISSPVTSSIGTGSGSGLFSIFRPKSRRGSARTTGHVEVNNGTSKQNKPILPSDTISSPVMTTTSLSRSSSTAEIKNDQLIRGVLIRSRKPANLSTGSTETTVITVFGEDKASETDKEELTWSAATTRRDQSESGSYYSNDDNDHEYDTNNNDENEEFFNPSLSPLPKATVTPSPLSSPVVSTKFSINNSTKTGLRPDDFDMDASIPLSFHSPVTSSAKFQTPGILSPSSEVIAHNNTIRSHFFKTNPDPEEKHFPIRVISGHIERVYSSFPNSSNRIFAEGYLIKSSENNVFYKSYKRRWFVLLGFVLLYYRNRSEKVPMHTGFIDMRGRVITGNEQKMSIEIGPFTGERPPLSRAFEVLRHHLGGGSNSKRGIPQDSNTHESDDEQNMTELASQLNRVTVDVTTGFPITMGSITVPTQKTSENIHLKKAQKSVSVAEAEAFLLDTELALLDTLGLSSQHDSQPSRSYKFYAPDRDSWILWMHLFTNSSYTVADLVSGTASYEQLPLQKLQNPDALIVYPDQEE